MKNILLLLLVSFVVFAESGNNKTVIRFNKKERDSYVSVRYFGKMYQKPDKSSSLLTVLDDNYRLRFISSKNGWIEVQGNGYRGWIEASQTNCPSEKIDNADQSDNDKVIDEIVLYIVLSIITLSFFVILFVALRKSKRTKLRLQEKKRLDTLFVSRELNGTANGNKVKKRGLSKLKNDLTLLVFSEKDKNIRTVHSHLFKKMSTCFKEIGFSVDFVSSVKSTVAKPDRSISMIAVDYTIHKRVIEKIEKLVIVWGVPLNTPIFFYNVKSPDDVTPGRVLSRTYFLGESFSDEDVLKIVAPVVEKEEKDNPNILQGRITGEGCFEIFQLMEIGKKTGTLILLTLTGKQVGVIGFDMGLITYAKSDRELGEIAASQLCMLKQGKFVFNGEEIAIKNCCLSITQLFLQLAKYEDENQVTKTQKEGNYEKGISAVHAF